MDKKNLQQVLITATLTSPIIALLVIAPIFMVSLNSGLSFFSLWVIIFVATLISWIIQIIIFYSLKKRGFKNWVHILTMLGIIPLLLFITNRLAFKVNPQFEFFSSLELWLLRLSIALAINFIIFILIDLIYTKEKQIQLTVDNATLKFNNLETEYKLLKAQINPHFLFNALNISKSLIRTRPEEAEKYIFQLSDFLRKSLTNHKESISLKKELEHCHQYIDLQKVRFEKALKFLANIDETLLNHHIPFFTLITLVENAIKHNAFTEEAPLVITIYTRNYFLIVKNNIKIKNENAHSNTGLANLNKRSEILSGSGITVENNGEDFIVKVKLFEP